MRTPTIKFTEKQKEFIINNNYMKTATELSELFNKHFNTNIEPKHIIYFRKNNKLKCGLTGQFEKGSTPHNKGKKWDEYMSKESQENSKKTQFKKRSKPHNWLPIGSEWVNEKGYVYVKIKEPNDWELKHRYIWEKNFGKIPEGYSVIFLDQNKNNFDLSNLQLVRIKDKLTAKNNNLLSSDKEVTKTGIMVAQLINKTCEIRKGEL